MDEAYRERRNIGQENPECSGCKKEIRTLSSFVLPQLKEGRSTELKSWKDRMVKSVKGKLRFLVRYVSTTGTFSPHLLQLQEMISWIEFNRKSLIQ